MWFFRVAVACGLRLKSSLMWAAVRLKEPSSWASVAALLTFSGMNVDAASCEGVQGFCMDKETWQALIGMGVGVSGFLAVVLREKPPVTIPADNVTIEPPKVDNAPHNSELERVQQEYPERRR